MDGFGLGSSLETSFSTSSTCVGFSSAIFPTIGTSFVVSSEIIFSTSVSFVTSINGEATAGVFTTSLDALFWGFNTDTPEPTFISPKLIATPYSSGGSKYCIPKLKIPRINKIKITAVIIADLRLCWVSKTDILFTFYS